MTPQMILTHTAESLILVAFLIFPMLQVVSGGGLSDVLLVLALPLLSIVVMGQNRNWMKALLLRWLIGLVLLGWVSIIWAHHSQQALNYARHVTVSVVIGMLLVVSTQFYTPTLTRRLRLMVPIGLLLGLALVVFEWKSFGIATRWWRMMFEHRLDQYYALDVLNKSLQFIAPLSFIVAGFMLGRIRLWAVIAMGGVLFLLLTQLNSLASCVGFMMGILVWGLYYYSNGRAVWLFKMALIIAAVAAPMLIFIINPHVIEVMQAHIPASAVHRLYIWQLYAKHMAEAWPFGVGIGGSNGIDQLTNIPVILQGLGIDPILRHPHNLWIQLYLELGVLGLILGIFLVLSLIQAIQYASDSIALRGLAYASLSCYLVIGMLDYDMWRDRWLAAGFIIAALIRLMLRSYGAVSVKRIRVSARDLNSGVA